MRESRIDQASGLRRLFDPTPWRRSVYFAAPEPALGRVGVLSLAAAFAAQGFEAHVDDDGAEDRPDHGLRLYDDARRLDESVTPDAAIDLMVQGVAGPEGVTDLYATIKRLLSAYRVDRLGVVLAGPAQSAAAERCRANLADAVERFTGARIDFWGSLGPGQAFRRAALARTSVQALDREGHESRAFERLAGHLLGGMGREPGPARH